MSRRADRATPSLLDRAEVRTELVATVVLLRPVDRTYSYIVPEELADRVAPGMRLTVPLGRNQRPAPAICLSVSREKWDSTLKPVLSLIDERPVLGKKLLELGRWISRYYAAHLGRTLDLMVPAGAKRGAGFRKVRYVRIAENQREGKKLPIDNCQLPIVKTAKNVATATPRQVAVLNVLREAGIRIAAAQLCAKAGCTQATLKTLEKRGLIEIQEELETALPEQATIVQHEPEYELNADQRAAINQISTAVAARKFSVQVLFGVTGSGKTEVYVATIRQALANGQQAILLVPEIALTTQTAERLSRRFERVVTLHSGLSDVQRSRAWSAIAAGQVDVVIGTRSAIFAPCPNLGVIVVDEEAEPSYKNQAAPRYHTRDVAVQRAHLEGIAVVLGSATPSLETWKNVRMKRHYQLIRMPERVRGLALPTVHLVDMREEHHVRRGVHMLSMAMEDHLRATLDRGEQAVLLLNRRGYASFLHCPKCRAILMCPRCSVHLVFHQTTGLAHCHYCQHKMAMPAECPTAACQGKWVRFGIGTQRVEEELGIKFPNARVRRMDSDVMRRPKDYAEVLGAFERREFDVLVGTQMIAKGLDFPFVSFVGVVSADTALALNDFRAEERTFQLVLQVSGRSGRGDVGGHVVVQTFAADTPAVRHAVMGDFEGFADRELNHRRAHGLPPFTRMMRIVLADEKFTKVRQESGAFMRRIEGLLQKRGIKAKVIGAQQAAIPRLRSLYRFDMQLIFATADAMIRATDVLQSEGALHANVKSVIVDVDPVSLQ